MFWSSRRKDPPEVAIRRQWTEVPTYEIITVSTKFNLTRISKIPSLQVIPGEKGCSRRYPRHQRFFRCFGVTRLLCQFYEARIARWIVFEWIFDGIGWYFAIYKITWINLSRRLFSEMPYTAVKVFVALKVSFVVSSPLIGYARTLSPQGVEVCLCGSGCQTECGDRILLKPLKIKSLKNSLPLLS